MEARTKWTDERLEERFDHIDERFDRVDDRFDRLESRFDRLDDRFDRLQIALVVTLASLLTAFAASQF
jgi:DNA anti-recombination protein RmuC